MRSILLAALCLFASGAASAQSCQPTSINYTTYYTNATNGTTLYASTITSGSSHMTIGLGCQPTHTVKAYNKLKNLSTGATVGGGTVSSSGCANCFLTAENDLNINPGGALVQQTVTGEADCSMVGQFFYSSFPLDLYIATTKSEGLYFIPPQNVLVSVISWCTPETTPPDFNPSYIADYTVHAFYIGSAVCVASPLWSGWKCPVGFGSGSNTTDDSKYRCSKVAPPWG